MMEQDFDEIGKRLYDLEANPPDTGWRRIAGTLNNAHPTRGGSWVRKNWWKPFVLIIPAFVYFGYQELDGTNPTSALQADVSKFNQHVGAHHESPIATLSNERLPEAEVVKPGAETNSGEQIADSKGSRSIHAGADEVSKVQDKNSPQENISETGRNSIASGAMPLKPRNSTQDNGTDSGASTTIPATEDREVFLPKTDGVVPAGSVIVNTSTQETKDSKLSTNRIANNNGVSSGTEGATMVNIPNDEAKVVNPSSTNTVANRDESSLNSSGGTVLKATAIVSISTDETNVSKPSNANSSTDTADVSSDKAESTVLEKASIVKNPLEEKLSESHPGIVVAATHEQPARDDDNSNLNDVTEKDSIYVKIDTDDVAEESNPTWTMNLSVMPQYVNRTIQPLATDEVLVTKANGNNTSTNGGIEIGIGVTRSLSKTWSLEARLSYNNLSQEITHSYSDGTVDTLIRVKQPDGSVRVTPVYQLTSRELKSDYHYASLSLGTTYYFWSRTKSRFSLSASADIHYLLAAQIKEKVNDGWESVGDNTTNKTNYSFTVGAGYSLTLLKGLELMIRPSLRYFTGDIKSTELPYKLSQRSVGINFVLSKTIGKS